MYLTNPSSGIGRTQSKSDQWLNPATTSKTSIICSVCPAPTPTRSILWGFGTIRGAVDGVVLAREPLSPLRRLDRLRDGIDDRCVRRGVCIGCLWVAAADPVPWLGCLSCCCRLLFLVAPKTNKNLQLPRWNPLETNGPRRVNNGFHHYVELLLAS